MDSKKKLDILRGSFESGIIDKEEYERRKQSLELDAKEFDRKIEDLNKPSEEEEPKMNLETLCCSIIFSKFNVPLIFTSI